MIKTIAEALTEEMARVKDLLSLYEATPYGIFAAAMMRFTLSSAQNAIDEQDVLKMTILYSDLKEYEA